MRRVVRPGGRVVIAEFSRPPVAAIRVPYTLYARHVMPFVAGVVNARAREAYRYLNESIETWPAQAELAAWLRDAGFERVAYRNLSCGIVALHRGFVPRDRPAPSAPAAPAASEVSAAPEASARAGAPEKGDGS
jgi:demethylmenaquinone methyltransferase/2-methoxy-6-polyprenyl-1,4-benzoquinol methylase